MGFAGQKIGFVGGGQMAGAIIAGLLAGGAVKPADVMVTDTSDERLAFLAAEHGIKTVPAGGAGEGAGEICKTCDILLLCVKPQVAFSAVPAFAKDVPHRVLVLSIMAGIALETLEDWFPKNPVVRVMPNTPMRVRRGVAGIARGKNTTAEQLALAEELFGQCGSVFVVPEGQIDALSSTSGCGPAFVYQFIEALSDGGVENGLPRALATQLAAETLAGAAEMVLQTGLHPAQLKDAVTSPGGSTIVGVHALEAGGMRAAVMDALAASSRRAAEMGKKG